MKKSRHYFISSDLDDLEAFEQDLERAGVDPDCIKVLSLDDGAVETHQHLHDVVSLMKRDIVRSGEYGLLVGVIAFFLVLGTAYLMGWTEGRLGWIPFVFLAFVLLGFFTWEGGFIGIQTSNSNFKRFEQDLRNGKHLLFIELAAGEEHLLDQAKAAHPSAESAGTGRATPHWIISWQQRLRHFFVETMP